MHSYREGFKFDLLTQRFIQNRWETPTGKEVYENIINSIKNKTDVGFYLHRYVLEHEANTDPYGIPYYPIDAMIKRGFWVLADNDLRGISFSGKDFRETPCLAKTSLSYSTFHGCKLNNANLEMTDLSCARFEECDCIDISIPVSVGLSTKFINTNLQKARLDFSKFVGCDFSGSDLRGAYFEGVLLEDIKVNYLTKFDEELRCQAGERTLPPEQEPDILRAIRIGYERAQLWHISDRFLFKERLMNRKNVMWPLFRRMKPFRNFCRWLGDLIWGRISGYGTKPIRIVWLGLISSLIFAVIYYFLGSPIEETGAQSGLLASLYFSFTTFATLGYGDLSYGLNQPGMRFLSTSEAWLGAITIALLVAVLAKKLLR